MRKKVTLVLDSELSMAKAQGSRAIKLYEVLKGNSCDVKIHAFGKTSSHNPDFKLLNFNSGSPFQRFVCSFYLVKSAVNNNSTIIVRGKIAMILAGLFSLIYKIDYGLDGHCKTASPLHEWLFEKKWLKILLWGPFLIAANMKSRFVIGITEEICAYNRMFFGKTTFCIPNGIDEKEILTNIDDNYVNANLDKSRKYIFYVGHQEPWVPLGDFLAASELTDKYEFVIVGENWRYKNYRKKFPKVIFLGKVPFKDTINLMHNYAFCFYHSWMDNEIWLYKSSRKLLEYLSIQKPILVNMRQFLPRDFINLSIIYDYKDGNPYNLIEIIDKLGKKNDYATPVDLRNHSWKRLVDASGIVEYLENKLMKTNG